jgi:NAD(P)-dependent dehydrogenase (short-subunit alcohol dehydrogenase family)
LQGFNNFHPIGRVGRPEDIAKTISFLLNDDSAETNVKSLETIMDGIDKQVSSITYF